MTAPASSTEVEHQGERAALTDATALVASQMWAEVDPQRIVDSWARQVPEMAAVVSGAQLAAAREADPYIAAAMAAEGLDDTAIAPVDPAGFSGRSADGRSLLSLLSVPAIAAVANLSRSRDVRRALAVGAQSLDTIVKTEIPDAGRLADQVSLTVHPAAAGYIRQTDADPCARCLILAGRWYRWSDGFQRHEECNCTHIPVGPDAEPQNPREVYDEMTQAQRIRAGFTLADQEALADGADIFQIVNARHRPGSTLTVAGERPRGRRRAQRTLEGTGARSRAALFRVDPETGRLVPRLAEGRPRWTVDEIYRVAGDDRQLAVDLLGEFGYLKPATSEPTLRDLQQAAKDLGLRGYSDLTRRQLVQRLERSGAFPAAPRLASILARGVGGGAPGGRAAGSGRARSVALLREIVAEHGVTVPTGVRKPALVQLVDDLESGKSPTIARQQAVFAIVDERRTAADALIRAAELQPTSSARALQHVGRSLRRDLPEDLRKPFAPLLDALDAADFARVQAAIPVVARAAKLRLLGGAPGEVKPFKAAEMERIGPEQAGTVFVVRPGYASTVDGGSVTLRRAAVAPATAEQLPVKAAKKAAPRKAAGSPDLAGARGLSTVPEIREVQIDNRVRRAVEELRRDPFARVPDFSGGSTIDLRAGGDWVLIPEIRTLLPDIDQAELDAALRRLNRQSGVRTSTSFGALRMPADLRARPLRIGGQDRHWFSMDDTSLRPLPAAPAKAAAKKAPAKATKAAPAKKATPRRAALAEVSDAAGTAQPKAGRVRGRDVVADDALTRRALAAGQDKSGEWGSGTGVGSRRGGRFDADEGGYQAHLTIARELGFDGLPTTVSPEEFARLADAGATELYRGWGWGLPSGGRTGRELAGQFIDGPLHVGGGHAFGTNFANNLETAVYYASHDRLTRIDGSAVVGMLLRRDARVASYPKLVAEHKKFLDSLPEGDPARLVYEDVGTYAMARGYDAMVVRSGESKLVRRAGEEEWIVFNRTALVTVREIEGVPLPPRRAAAPAKKATAAKRAPAPKAPPAPAKMTAPALRKELTTAGAPEALVAGVPQPVLARYVTQLRETGDALAAGRLRQEVIDRRRALADAVSEAAELLDSGASGTTLGARAAQRLRRVETLIEGWPQEAPLRALVTAMTTGNPTTIRRAIATAERRGALTRLGPTAGDTARYDRRAMTPLAGDPIPDGATVRVVRPGYEVDIAGERVVLMRPVVEVADLSAVPAPSVAQMRRLVDQETPIETRVLPGGRMAKSVEVRTYATGERVVIKQTQGSEKAVREADAEELAALVAEATGARSPRVARLGPDMVAMGYVDGSPGAALSADDIAAAMRSESGRRLGLADLLMRNSDRNPGNWFRLADGTIVGIDHGNAWYASSRVLWGANEFNRHLVEKVGRDWVLRSQLDLSRADLATIRRKLQALRPRFARIGEQQWFTDMMDMLAEMQKRATRP